MPNFRLIAVLWRHNCIGLEPKTTQILYFFTHSLKPLLKFEVSGRGKVDQGFLAILEGGQLCPAFWLNYFTRVFNL